MRMPLTVLCLLVLGYSLAYGLAVLVARMVSERITQEVRSFRVRYRAWLPRLLRTKGVTIFGVIWLADAGATAYLLSHEYHHTEQERGRWYLGYLPVVLWDFDFQGGHQGSHLERDAVAFADAHWTEFTDIREAE